jgi:hypothetical protein
LPNHAFSWSAETGEERDQVISCSEVSDASRIWPAWNSSTRVRSPAATRQLKAPAA